MPKTSTIVPTTVADLKNSALKSGYKGVWASKDLKSFHAQAGTAKVGKSPWFGVTRRTAEEAAQDYIDYVNGQPLLTIEDIRNPKRKSGFEYVRYSNQGRGNSYQAATYKPVSARGVGSNHDWLGARRATAEEAAQDYVDYVNGQRATPAPQLKTAAHQYTSTPIKRDAEELAAIGILRDKRAQRAGRQGYVYLITDSEYVKVGYSVNPPKRCAELQTGNARLLVLLATMKGTLTDEAGLHAKYAQFNTLQEWFEMELDLLKEFTDSNHNFKKDHEA